MIGLVTMYCDTVFFSLSMYTIISSSIAYCMASTNRGLLQILSGRLLGILPVICLATQWWNPPRVRNMRGVTNHVFDPNIRVAWTTAI